MKPSILRTIRCSKNAILIDFLAVHLKLSKKKAKALLDARSVLVNDRRVWMARHRLSPGDTIAVALSNSPKTTSLPRRQPLFENEHFLVIDKPPGLVSNGRKSVEEKLRADRGEADLVVAHRLDRDTSGCLLVARTPRVFDAVVKMFKQHGIQKQYHAIVHGRVKTPDRRITFPIDGQRALTLARTLDCSPEASHLLIKIETGRTHQIRKHLASLGHPVLGDREHGLRTATSESAKHLTRHMLHASSLQFVSPIDGRRIRVASPLPRDFQRCLERMNLT